MHNRGSVRSENTRNENNPYILMEKESMHTFKVETVSQRCKRLCSRKLKSVKFRIIAKWNLSLRYDDHFSWICAVILDISKKLTWFPSVTYLGLQTGKVWAKSIFRPWPGAHCPEPSSPIQALWLNPFWWKVVYRNSFRAKFVTH